jgi:hypothetical protein
MSVLFLLAIVSLPVLATLAWGARGVARDLGGERPIQVVHIAAIVLCLLFIDAVFSVVWLVRAGLSHSSALIEQAHLVVGVGFVVLVLLPAAALLLIRRMSR